MIDDTPKVGSERSLRANMLMGSSARVVTIAASLIVSPVIVTSLGLKTYGFWALLQGLLFYVQLADGGFPAAASAMVGRAVTQHEVKRILAVAVGAMIPVCALIMGAAAAFVAFAPHEWIATFPGGWQASILLVAAAVALTMLGSAFSAAVSGLERWDLLAIGQLAGQLAASILTVVLLKTTGGMESVAASLAIGAFITCAYFAFYAARLQALSWSPALLSRAVFRELFEQGSSMQIVAFAAVTTAQADRYLLLPFASLPMIGAYDLGARVALSIKALPTAALGPITTRMAVIHGDQGLTGVSDAYPAMFRGGIALGVAPLIALYGVAFPAVLAWLGTSFTVSAGCAVVLGVGYALNFATGPGTSTARGAKRASIERDYTILALIINIVFTVIFGVLWGFWGVVAATTAGMIVGSYWLIWRVDRWLGLETTSIAAAVRHGSTRAATVGAVVVATASVATSLVASSAGATRWEQLALAGVFGCVVIATVGRDTVLRPVLGRLRRPTRPRDGVAQNES